MVNPESSSSTPRIRREYSGPGTPSSRGFSDRKTAGTNEMTSWRSSRTFNRDPTSRNYLDQDPTSQTRNYQLQHDQRSPSLKPLDLKEDTQDPTSQNYNQDPTSQTSFPPLDPKEDNQEEPTSQTSASR